MGGSRRGGRAESVTSAIRVFIPNSESRIPCVSFSVSECVFPLKHTCSHRILIDPGARRGISLHATRLKEAEEHTPRIKLQTFRSTQLSVGFPNPSGPGH